MILLIVLYFVSLLMIPIGFGWDEIKDKIRKDK